MQNFLNQTNVSHSNFLLIAHECNNPEIRYSFDLAGYGTNFVFGKQNNQFLLIRSELIIFQESIPEKQLDGTLIDFLRNLELPVRVNLELGGSAVAGWLSALRMQWLGVELESGRNWIHVDSIKKISWSAVDN